MSTPFLRQLHNRLKGQKPSSETSEQSNPAGLTGVLAVNFVKGYEDP